MTILTPFRGKNFVEQFFGDWENEENSHIPEIQIKKNDKEYKVTAKIPGAKKEDIKVEVENGYLKVSGEYKNFEAKESEKYDNIHSEYRSYTAFERALSIDASRFEVDKVDAKFKDGLLEISLPLKASAKPKQINVQVA